MKLIEFISFFIVILISSCGIFKSSDDLYFEAEAKRNTGNSYEALVLKTTRTNSVLECATVLIRAISPKVMSHLGFQFLDALNSSISLFEVFFTDTIVYFDFASSISNHLRSYGEC